MIIILKNVSALALTLCTVVSCTTPPPPEVVVPVEKPWGTFETLPSQRGAYNQISIGALHTELQIPERRDKDIGYLEKGFNTCDVKANTSTRPSCRKMYTGSLRFRMTCRNNEGIVREADLLPLQVNNVLWKSGPRRGTFSTDADGYGVIRFISQKTARSQPMKFYMGKKVVYKRLKDLWRIVLPPHWCS